MNKFYVYLTLFIITCFQFSCSKITGTSCSKINNIHINPVSPVESGTTLVLHPSAEYDDVYYEWAGGPGAQSFDKTLTIASITTHWDGMYYLRVSSDRCGYHEDSIYVHVLQPQGSPTCNAGNNTISFSSSAISGTRAVGNVVTYTNNFNEFTVTGSSASPYIRASLYFSDYWITHPLEDGIYKTSGSQYYHQDIDDVFIEIQTDADIIWSAINQQPLYISHVNGKLRVTFCDLDLINFGPGLGNIHGQFTGSFTQP